MNQRRWRRGVTRTQAMLGIAFVGLVALIAFPAFALLALFFFRGSVDSTPEDVSIQIEGHALQSGLLLASWSA